MSDKSTLRDHGTADGSVSSTPTSLSRLRMPLPKSSTPLSVNNWYNTIPVLSYCTCQKLIEILKLLSFDHLVKEIQRRAPNEIKYSITLCCLSVTLVVKGHDLSAVQ